MVKQNQLDGMGPIKPENTKLQNRSDEWIPSKLSDRMHGERLNSSIASLLQTNSIQQNSRKDTDEIGNSEHSYTTHININIWSSLHKYKRQKLYAIMTPEQ